jgi:dipeptidase E|tara:strand:- start:2651 stop:3349 length:699 start_codon:yes stop_codon:yes gene_type:complete
MRQVIAIGGGGFGRSIGDLLIEKYIIKQCPQLNPKICFIPTATGDDQGYIDNFYKAFDSLGCNTSHINLFKRTFDLRSFILDQDIIYVGGGNTKSMLAVWRDWGLDLILKEAYDKGIIMSGVSAGAICWFDKGITDSWAEHQGTIKCMGFVNGTCCPHYDEEPERIPYVEKILKDGDLNSCLAIEGYAALHLVDDSPKYSISFKTATNCHNVSYIDGSIIHEPINGTIKINL